MKRFYSIITINVVLVLNINCQNKSNLNVFCQFYNNGKIKEEVYINKQGKADGVLKRYYESGKLKDIISMNDGIQDGVTISYFENGNIKIINHFKNGSAFGDIFTYYENGKLNKQATLHDTIYIGDYLKYNFAGYLEEYMFKSESGTNRYYRKYNKEGVLIEETGGLLVDLKFDTLNDENTLIHGKAKFASPPNSILTIHVAYFGNNGKLLDNIKYNKKRIFEFNLDKSKIDSIKLDVTIFDNLSKTHSSEGYLIEP